MSCLYGLMRYVLRDESAYIIEEAHRKSLPIFLFFLLVHFLIFITIRDYAKAKSKGNTILAISSNNLAKYSETFIHNQFRCFNGKIVAFGDGYYPRMYSTDRGLHWEPIQNYTSLIQKLKIGAILANYGPAGVAWIPLTNRLNIPLYVHFHGFDAYRSDVLTHYGQTYLDLFRSARAIIVVSNAMKSQLIELGCPEIKLHVVPCGIDVSFFSPGLEMPDKNFITVGRFVAKKAPLNTLRAFHKLHAIDPEVRLVMIGDGPLMEACKTKVDEWGLNNAVTFKGVCTPEEVLQELRLASIFVLHSIKASDGDSEGCPTSIMEAGACGIPVIATRHTGIPEIVIDGETGYLVHEGDIETMAEKMRKLMADSDLRKKMGKAARIRIEKHFNLDQYIERLEQIVYNS